MPKRAGNAKVTIQGIAYLEAAQKRLSLEYSEIQHNLSHYVDTITSCVVTSFGHETWLAVQEGR